MQFCKLVLSGSVQFSRSAMSDSLRPSRLQHARFPCHHQLPEPAQTYVHPVGDAIQPSHPLLSPSPSAFSLSQHQVFQPMNGEGNGNPLQYSCLENPMEGGAWQATVHGVSKSRTGLNYFTFTFFPHYFSQTRACHWHSLCEDGHSFSLSSVRNDNLRHRNLNKQMCCEKPQRIRSLGLSSNPFHIYTKGVLTSKLNENVEALNIYLLFIFTIN